MKWQFFLAFALWHYILGVNAGTKDEALIYFNLANEKYMSGEFDEAEQYYLQSLDRNGNNADVYCNYASLVLDIDASRAQESVQMYQRAIEINPNHMDALFNLGMLYQDAKQELKAIETYSYILEHINTNHFETLSNIAACYHAQGELKQAIDYYRRAIAQTPNDDPNIYNTLSLLHERLGRAYLKLFDILTLQQEEEGKEKTRFASLRKQGLESLSVAVRYNDGNEMAKHLLAANSHKDFGYDTASPAFVESLFDEFAESFEKSLEELNYATPQLIAQEIGQLRKNDMKLYPIGQGGMKDTFGVVVDLGAGTGLLGPFFKNESDSLLVETLPVLIGVDLSTEMLLIAEKKNIYNHLYVGDIVVFLKMLHHHIHERSCAFNDQPPTRRKMTGTMVKELTMIQEDNDGLLFDASFQVTPEGIGIDAEPTFNTRILYAAADVFVYIGDLKEVFNSVGKAIREGDYFVFSVEQLRGKEQKEIQSDWKLQSNGRYAHSKKYIFELVAEEQMAMEMVLFKEFVARIENKQAVNSYMVVLRGVK